MPSPLPLLRDRRGVCHRRGRAGPVRRGRRADGGRPRGSAAAGARSGAALVRPRRRSRSQRCARHSRLGPRRGFSLDACVRIEGQDRPGLERLLRYRARSPFALERLEQLAHDQLVYRFPKPQPDGRTELRLTPLELIERLAAAPAPRIHRHRYHGVLAPNAPLRAQVTALAPQRPAPLPNAAPAPHAPTRSPARYLWALLLARIYEVLPLRCARCGRQDAHHCLRHRGARDPFHPHLPGRADRRLPKWPRHVARRCGSRPPSPTGMTPRTRA